MGKATKGKTFENRELTPQAASAASRLTPYFERGAAGERFGVELLIGPEEAEFLLSFNPDNRNLRPTKIAQFIRDMRHGRWHSNGESLVVASTGELNDGQHRLQAILQSKVPQKLMIAFGYPRESRYTVDSGAARSAGEHLHMAGMPYGSAMAAAARLVLSYEQAAGKGIGRISAISSLEVQERAKSDVLLQEVVTYCDKHRVPFIRTALVSSAFYILARIAPLEAKEYIDGILTGVNLTSSDPAYLARERLMRAWTNKTNTGKRFTDMESMEILFRGWNFYATGKLDAEKLQKMGSFPVLKKPRQASPAFAEAAVVAERIADDDVAVESIVPYDTRMGEHAAAA
jgi:hypothetical protein